jgi:uncharacterized phage protein (TIGR01671 family)
MREIKFRAWDLENKRMFEVSYIGFKTSGKIDNVMGFGNEKDNEERIKRGGSLSITANGQSFTYGTLQLGLINFELMQYTGLKDKNGKEIYEGDILKSKQFVARNLFHNNLGIVDLPLQEQWIEISTELEKDQVIGNIFENPELLKEKK